MSRNPHPPPPAAGSRWQHYKGGFHTVVTIAKREGSAEPLVIHKAAGDAVARATPLTEWRQHVGKDTPRFAPVGAAAAKLQGA